MQDEYYKLSKRLYFNHVYFNFLLFTLQNKEIMSKKKDIDKVIHLLSWWLTKIKLNNCLNLYDINIISEDIALMLLNEIYDLKLENLNYKQSNYHAIDLGDKKKGIAFQISSSIDSQKVKRNLETFRRDYKKNYPGGIRFLILSMEASKIKLLKKNKQLKYIVPWFNPCKHILSEKEIIREIAQLYSQNRAKFYKVKQILEKEIEEKMFREQ